MTGNKEQKIPIGDIPNSFLIVNFDWEIIKNPPALEEGHGLHEINQDEILYSIQSISLNLCGTDFQPLNIYDLSEKQLSTIEDALSICGNTFVGSCTANK